MKHFPSIEPVRAVVVQHDDLIQAFMDGDDETFERLHAVYYPEGEDMDGEGGL